MVKRIVVRISKFCKKKYKNTYSSFKANLLGKMRMYSVSVNSIWDFSIKDKDAVKRNDEIVIFGHNIHHEDIKWNRDYVSGFEFPGERFDSVNIKRFFNRGIDIKFPWELSRCYFFVA